MVTLGYITPVIFVDNDGRFAWAIPGAIIGAIAGGIAGAIISYNKTGEVDWRYIAIGAAGGALIGAGAGYLAQAAFTAATATTATAGTPAITGGSTLSSVGAALAADGDPTNEVKYMIDSLIQNPGIQWTSSQIHLGERMMERGLDISTIYSTIANGVAHQQTFDKFRIYSMQATVVITRSGEVITAWAYSDNTKKIIDFLLEIFGG